MKIMLITGASRGIGAATALLAAAQGYTLALHYHTNKEAAEHIASQARAMGARAECLKADIASEEQIIKMFVDIDRTIGPVSVLVNNAGILERQMRLEDMDAQRMHRIFAVNAIGQMVCAREAFKRMALKFGGSGGCIVNVSSIAAKTGSPFEYIDYAASKGAIDTFTIGLAKEAAAEGVRVNGVRPALIHTDIHASGGDPGRIERLTGRIPMGRGGMAEEVAEAILFLASDKASYSTGTFIDVSGGIL